MLPVLRSIHVEANRRPLRLYWYSLAQEISEGPCPAWVVEASELLGSENHRVPRPRCVGQYGWGLTEQQSRKILLAYRNRVHRRHNAALTAYSFRSNPKRVDGHGGFPPGILEQFRTCALASRTQPIHLCPSDDNKLIHLPPVSFQVRLQKGLTIIQSQHGFWMTHPSRAAGCQNDHTGQRTLPKTIRGAHPHQRLC